MKKRKIALIGLVSLLALNLLMPTKIKNPVEGCGRESYNPKSFWGILGAIINMQE